MTLFGKLEAEVEIKSEAAKFHDVFGYRPHHVNNMAPQIIQGCDLHDGEFGKSGSIIQWEYIHEGKVQVAKEIIESVDDENNIITLKVVGGNILEEYKSFKFVIQVTPKEGGGSIAHMRTEYEKLHENIPEPNSLMETSLKLFKDVDAHLQAS